MTENAKSNDKNISPLSLALLIWESKLLRWKVTAQLFVRRWANRSTHLVK